MVHSGDADAATEEAIKERIEHVARSADPQSIGAPTAPAWEFRASQIGHHVVDDLVAAVEDCAAALLVIGIRRRTSVGKFVMGSDAQRILMLAQCPVLAVKAGTG